MKNSFFTTKSRASRQAELSGFVLVEAIAAVSIILMALPVAMDTAMKAISAASHSKNEMIATYLAQEGIDIVRQRRDSNILAGGGAAWANGLYPECGEQYLCHVDAATMEVGKNNNATQKTQNEIVYIDGTGLYSQPTSSSGLTPTIFKRNVEVKPAPSAFPFANDELRVVSTVTYTTQYGSQKVEVIEYLYNWYQV